MPPLSGRRPPCQKYRYFFEHPSLTLTYFTDADGVEWSCDEDDVYRRVTDEDRREYDTCVQAARRSCQLCPIRAQCLRNALVGPAPVGVVAGLKASRELTAVRTTLGLTKPPDSLNGSDKTQDALQEHRAAAEAVLSEYTDEELLNTADDRRRKSEIAASAKRRAGRKPTAAKPRRTGESSESQSGALQLFPRSSLAAARKQAAGSGARRGTDTNRGTTAAAQSGEQLGLDFSQLYESNTVGAA